MSRCSLQAFPRLEPVFAVPHTLKGQVWQAPPGPSWVLLTPTIPSTLEQSGGVRLAISSGAFQ